MIENKMIYLDHAATTSINEEVLKEMMPYLTNQYGNPSSIYSFGRKSKKAIEKAREQIAATINAKKSEIYFTSGGTESDNWAIKGIAGYYKKKGKHIITSSIEHHAVINSCKRLEKEGFEISYLPVDKDGKISIEDLKKSIRKDTILISIMMANNEIGTIEPIAEIGKIAREKGIIFHTDAIQAVGCITIDVEDLQVDLLSISAHKFYGPKGVGALYIRKGTGIDSLMDGGEQEKGKRGSTENVSSIVGIGKAIELANKNLIEYQEKLCCLRDEAIIQILKNIPNTKLNGHAMDRLPGNVNILFEGMEAETMILKLDKMGFVVSSGAACSSGLAEPSHVLKAIGLSHEKAQCSLRFTFGEENNIKDVKKLVEALKKIYFN
ncbi:cysteine desulfurase NifS [Clostridium tertium]|uniref:cysteine desulfurase NifS n=1 Tax=Clostridium tertium TaxID=1559 RepID=UPI00232BB1F6|nr:cysteine desulfurase NifS [Clostridium tertium]MDB1921610.1 cysteine desulfurase NifS [Clostridium tertium]MDB1924814.1 cysteine desulfurase NifS [Clostridium tertium]MDB1930579.1 cysteine desulfurase NifS [Clostridium tertium]